MAVEGDLPSDEVASEGNSCCEGQRQDTTYWDADDPVDLEVTIDVLCRENQSQQAAYHEYRLEKDNHPLRY